MKSSAVNILYRLSIGTSAFVMAGGLIVSILGENGGSPNSQAEWNDAQARRVAISSSQRELASAQNEVERPLDQILTGSIKPIQVVDPSGDVELPADEAEPKELSVLSIIRENSDVVPGVSSGTNRVSVTVKKGDTLFGIAKRHGLTTHELARMNGLSEPYVIKIDQTLYVAR